MNAPIVISPFFPAIVPFKISIDRSMSLDVSPSWRVISDEPNSTLDQIGFDSTWISIWSLKFPVFVIDTFSWQTTGFCVLEGEIKLQTLFSSKSKEAPLILSIVTDWFTVKISNGSNSLYALILMFISPENMYGDAYSIRTIPELLAAKFSILYRSNVPTDHPL